MGFVFVLFLVLVFLRTSLAMFSRLVSSSWAQGSLLSQLSRYLDHRWATEPCRSVALLDSNSGCTLYLGHAGLGCLLLQQGQGCVHVTLTGCGVQGRVASSGSQVGAGAILQQELHHVRVANASSTVKRCLVILGHRVKA